MKTFKKGLGYFDRVINPFIALGEIITRGLFKDAALLIIFVCIHYLFLSLAPTSLWATYYNLTIQSSDHGKIEVYSDREKRSAAAIDTHDFLLCYDEDGEFRKFSSMQSYGKVIAHPRMKKKWQYEGAVPTYATTCQIQSDLFIKLDYGISRHMYIESNYFHFSP